MKGRSVYLIPLSIAFLLGISLICATSNRAYADNGVSPTLTPWQDELPIPPVATPGSNKLGDYYEIKMVESTHQFHSELDPATIWTYVQAGSDPVHLGPTIVARKNRAVTIKWINELPTSIDDFPLKDSIDDTIMGSDLPSGRAIPHLHGGHSAARFDGTPHQWWTAGGATGPDYVTDTFIFVNDEPACLKWYHDHAWGVTRMNPYLGLAAAYLIVDNVDNGSTILGQRVPAGYGKYHIPLVLQDKTFNDDGSLWYPTEGLTPTHPIWVPEFFGDTPVVNGKAYPYFNAQPRRYRFRMLNGAQARFFNVHFHVDGGADLPFWVIGSEGGLLPKPAAMTAVKLAPGERFDVIADFTGLALGTTITLTNDNPVPDPDGQDPIIVTDLMQIRVNTPVPADDPDRTKPPASLILPRFPRLVPTRNLPARDIVLKENFYEGPADPDFPDAIGSPIEVLLNGYHFTDPTTDFVRSGTTETWQWVNLTGDTHPMHPHLVTFQTLNRQAFDVGAFDTDWQTYLATEDPDTKLRDESLRPKVNDYLINGVLPPAPEEMGYKDTVKSPPGYVTRIRAKFTLPWTAFLDYNPVTRSFGSWVYHCHILEHEENDMMRPFEVVW